MNIRHLFAVGLGVCLVACVTVNVYFPESAAERAADIFIKDVYGGDESDHDGASAPSGSPQGAIDSKASYLFALSSWVGNILIPSAAAQPIDISISTPGISALQNAMEQRHRQLKAHYNSGAIGMSASGLIILRDPKLVGLQQRNQIKKLVVDENADRNRLYGEVAKANGHPEWEKDIRETFAARWVGNAPAGWWYQSGGSWKQK